MKEPMKKLQVCSNIRTWLGTLLAQDAAKSQEQTLHTHLELEDGTFAVANAKKSQPLTNPFHA